ncbi:MAG: class I tRNA ligase family protein, partial [Chthoniobacterales bacterium]
VPALVGKYVFDANSDIVQLLRDRGALLFAETYQHSYPYCWRSKTPIIFRAVEQFFIRLDELRGKALDAITKVKWLPAWGENRIAGTVESRPDWVISRQRSWGVPLPVFYSAEGEPILNAEWIRRLADLVGKRGSNVWFELSDADLVRELDLPAGLTKRNDTIDVWIDSGVSHKAVCAARPELHDPAEVYIEATDQHRGWFQSSLMTSVALHDRAPYKTCITHGFVVDVDGKKISKSSSYEKPMDAMHFVKKHGADIVRLWVSSVNYTDDVPFSEEMFTRLGDTYRRIRNTLRILHGNLFDFEAEPASEPTLVDRWIVTRLRDVVADCRAAYERYEFHKVYHTINDFCAVDLSSLYIDITKDRMYCDAADSPRRRATQSAMREIYDALCRLLAPILAFTAEEAWSYLQSDTSVHAQLFPQLSGRRDDYAVSAMNEALALREEVTRELEQARQHKIVGNSLEAKVCIEVQRKKLVYDWFDDLPTLEEILILSDLRLVDGVETKAVVGRSEFAKCARCWRHRESVGKSQTYPDLCGRCEAVVTEATKVVK